MIREKTCPDQYRAPTGNALFKFYTNVAVVSKGTLKVVEIMCRNNDKECGYIGREKDCPYSPLKPGEKNLSDSNLV